MGRLLVVVLALLTLALGGAAAHGATLVALGDSYSSGEGTPPFVVGTAVPGDTCHRSTRAWPVLVARRLHLRARSFACSGAVTRDVRSGDRGSTERERRVAQAARLARVRGVRLVTITIGGNDAGFAPTLIYCLTHVACQVHFRNGGHDLLDAQLPMLRRRLAATYRAVRRAAPHARLVVVGYPRLFPVDPTPLACPTGLLEPDEMRYLNEKAVRLDGAIAAVARRAHTRFVRTLDAFAGHEVSCDASAWINPITVPIVYSFHPNLLGQRRLAEVVASALHAP